ncbi:MAG: hypothetical protein Q7T36_07500 [Fluviicoccus sp.]|uniref:hypothetical protein n=1 Tax=Fluviicoccus sp. TaxID=2003552 RepID=UPI00271C0CE2|nr:hypothetical protein [Fluviicoccus sp.]MDO8330299.1 hypothetical protein [Fluviicoccus sp.]
MPRQTEQRKWTGWIDRKNPKQLEWAVNYLANHFIGDPRIRDFGAYLDDAEKSFTSQAAENLDKALIVYKRMRAAWNSKKIRGKTSDRKGYSYVMSTGVAKKMRELAGNKSVSETLEDIIEHAYQLHVADQRVIKINLHHEKERKDRQQRQIDDLQFRLNSANYEVELEKKKIKLIKATLCNLWLELSIKDITLKRFGHNDMELTKEEKASALKDQKIYLEFFERKLKADIEREYANLGTQKLSSN